MNAIPATTVDDRDLSALSRDECELLVRELLAYFPVDQKLASYGLRNRAPFNRFSKRAVSNMIGALVATGILEMSGERRDAAYQLTERGVLVKNSLP